MPQHLHLSLQSIRRDSTKFEGLQVFLQDGEVGEVDDITWAVRFVPPRQEGRGVHPYVPQVFMVVIEEKLVLYDGH